MTRLCYKNVELCTYIIANVSNTVRTLQSTTLLHRYFRDRETKHYPVDFPQLCWLFNGVYMNSETSLTAGTFVFIHPKQLVDITVH